jgi:hypothetical protein
VNGCRPRQPQPFPVSHNRSEGKPTVLALRPSRLDVNVPRIQCSGPAARHLRLPGDTRGQGQHAAKAESRAPSMAAKTGGRKAYSHLWSPSISFRICRIAEVRPPARAKRHPSPARDRVQHDTQTRDYDVAYGSATAKSARWLRSLTWRPRCPQWPRRLQSPVAVRVPPFAPSVVIRRSGAMGLFSRRLCGCSSQLDVEDDLGIDIQQQVEQIRYCGTNQAQAGWGEQKDYWKDRPSEEYVVAHPL